MNQSMFLFSRPSFAEGMARIIDFGGTLNEYNSSLSNAQADRLAFQADLAALRNDLALVLKRLQTDNDQTDETSSQFDAGQTAIHTTSK